MKPAPPETTTFMSGARNTRGRTLGQLAPHRFQAVPAACALVAPGSLRLARWQRCDKSAVLFYPYTERFPEAATTAALCTATVLTAALFRRPFSSRAATATFALAIWVAALCPAPNELSKALQ